MLPLLSLPFKDGAGKGGGGGRLHRTPSSMFEQKPRERGREKKSQCRRGLTRLLKPNVSTGFNPPLAFKS